MYKRSISDADLVRLLEERATADRLYNEALTELDRALTSPAAVPAPPPPPETTKLPRLNELWQIVPPQPVPSGGWRARLGAFVWRMVGPLLQRQQEFNAALVEHLNRSASKDEAATAAAAAAADRVSAEFAALAGLQSRLITYLQQITLYIDTKDRDEVGRVRHEMERRTEGLAAGLSALGDELLKRKEDARLHQQRLETRMAELRAELGRSARAVAAVPSQAAPGVEAPSGRGERNQLAGSEESATYSGFEDLYRGSVEEISERLAAYLPLFAGARDIVDLGCGRGEFLLALREHGISGRGVDLNPDMIARCTALGLDVVQGDAVEFLASLPEASVDGVFAAQVVEHLPPDRLVRLLDLARARLRPGGRVVLETVNAACWAAFFSSYVRDITHVQPVHPDTLRYLLVARGFQNVDIRFSSPYPAEAKLRPLPLTLTAGDPAVAEVVEEFNRNVEVLNGQLFTYLDYAAIGERPGRAD